MKCVAVCAVLGVVARAVLAKKVIDGPGQPDQASSIQEVTMGEWLRIHEKDSHSASMAPNHRWTDGGGLGICEVTVGGPDGYAPEQLALVPEKYFNLPDFSRFSYNAQHALCYPESCVRLERDGKEVVLKVLDKVPGTEFVGVDASIIGQMIMIGQMKGAKDDIYAVKWNFQQCPKERAQLGVVQNTAAKEPNVLKSAKKEKSASPDAAAAGVAAQQ